MAGNEKGAGLSQRLYKRKGPTAEAVGPTTHPIVPRFPKKSTVEANIMKAFYPLAAFGHVRPAEYRRRDPRRAPLPAPEQYAGGTSLSGRECK